MKVLVCGGRNYFDRAHLFSVLDTAHDLFGITEVIHGAARGADSLAGEWADARGVQCAACPALWDIHGRSAGIRRNASMLADGKPDVVLGFPGGTGTADMLRRAERAGVQVWRA